MASPLAIQRAVSALTAAANSKIAPTADPSSGVFTQSHFVMAKPPTQQGYDKNIAPSVTSSGPSSQEFVLERPNTQPAYEKNVAPTVTPAEKTEATPEKPALSQYDIRRQAAQVAGTEEEKAKLDAIKRRMAAQGIGDSGINMAEQRLASADVSRETAGKTGAIDVEELQAGEKVQEQERNIAAQQKLAEFDAATRIKVQQMATEAELGKITLQDQLTQHNLLTAKTADSWYNKGFSGESVDQATLDALKTSDPLSYASYVAGQAGVTKEKHDHDVNDFISKRDAMITSLDPKQAGFAANLQVLYAMKPGDTIVDTGGILSIQGAGTPTPPKGKYTPTGDTKNVIDKFGYTYDANTGIATNPKPARLDSPFERKLPTGAIIPKGTPVSMYDLRDASGQQITKYVTNDGNNTTFYTTAKGNYINPTYLQPVQTDNGIVFQEWKTGQDNTVTPAAEDHGLFGLF
jgi:hypothetical protein